MKRTSRATSRIVAPVLALVFVAARASACPTCRSALSEGGARWAHGFALSIAVLLGVLLVSAGAFGLAVWRSTRDPR